MSVEGHCWAIRWICFVFFRGRGFYFEPAPLLNAHNTALKLVFCSGLAYLRYQFTPPPPHFKRTLLFLLKAEDAPGQRPDFTSLFRGLILDEDRSLASTSSGVGGLPLPPFAMVQDPPPPVSEERKAEILNDPRVKAQQQSAKEGREEKKENKEEEAAAAVAASSATAAAS